MSRNVHGFRFLAMSATAALAVAQAGAALAGDAAQLANEQVGEADLVVHASGFKSDQGHAVADLFVEGESILGKPHIRITGNIGNGTATLTFSHMKYGAYAVRVFHDENGNGQLDHNFMSIPAEPLGFSNGFSLGLLSWFPTFEKLRFEFRAGAVPLAIVVK